MRVCEVLNGSSAKVANLEGVGELAQWQKPRAHWWGTMVSLLSV